MAGRLISASVLLWQLISASVLLQRNTAMNSKNLSQFSSGRLIFVTAGAAVALFGIKNKRFSSVVLLGLGFAAAIRLLGQFKIKTLFFPTIQLRRTVYVNAPVETVFKFWRTFSNFPKFMSYVEDVTVNDRQGFTWSIKGPAGGTVRWDATVKALIPIQLISWQSTPGALISNSGKIQFKFLSQNKTEIKVTLTYSPRAGALGYGVIWLLGFDPRSRIDADLKSMINQIGAENNKKESTQKTA